MNSSSTWFSELVKTWPREKLLAAAVLKQRGVDLEALFRPATVSQSSIPFCPQEPKPKQQVFLELTGEEALFGGAAGPGKSSALLMAALQYVEVPEYAALLLRRTYADLSLPGALMDRLGEWLRPTAARWNNTEKTWVFPSGATITFGYLETEVSKFRYQGAEFSMIGFDELSQFSESQYRYLFSRLRRLEGSAVPMRMRAATNPGAEWVKQRFEIQMGREELVQWTADGQRAFVPARLSDNDSVDADAYIRMLDRLDPITRKQLLEGDWDVRPEGALFKREWFEVQSEAPAGGRRVRFYDLAASAQGDFTAGVRMRREGGRYYVEDLLHGRWSPHERDALILQTAALDGRGVEIVIEQEPGASGLAQIAALVTMLAGYRVSGRRSTGDKITRAGPLASQCEAGNVRLIEGAWNRAFLDEIAAFPEGSHDDIVDSTSGAFLVLAEPTVDPLLGLVIGRAVRGW